MLKARLADIAAAIRSVPNTQDWVRTVLELGWSIPLLLVVAHLGGLIRIDPPTDPITVVSLAAILLVTPSIGEELIFRALLISRTRPTTIWIVLSTVLFVAWHPLQAATVGPPWSATFLNGWFLASTAILGLALARIYARTGSIWPCVAAHWLIVFSWKVFFGGPF